MASLHYDPTGRLYQSEGFSGGVSQGAVRYLYDGNAMIGEYDAAGTLLRRYVHGSNVEADDPLVWYEGSLVNSSSRRYLQADPRGSIVAVTNYLGDATAINAYDEYGIPDAATGNDVASKGRFRYTGQAWLPELGMYYYKARIYSPQLGRFLQTDPIGCEDQFNLYAYVGNDPINGVDQTGERQIYVGGACDGTCGRTNSPLYNYSRGRGRFHTWIDRRGALNEIRVAAKNGEPIVLIGHSLGGRAAAQIAAMATREGIRVDFLVTVDAVGALSDVDKNTLKDFTGLWVNIRRFDTQDTSRGDSIANIGERWLGSFTTGNHEDVDLATTRHHEEVVGMMQDAQIPEMICATDKDGRGCKK